jgi:hypothetical protein
MDETPNDDEHTIDRRTYLTLAGATVGTAAIAGCSGGGATSANELRYGFGGAPVVLAAGSTALQASSEAEPNDACGDATPIATDTTVSGTLDAADVDWYSVDLAAEEPFDVVFDRTATDGVTNVVISGPDCSFKTLRQVGSAQETRVSATADEAGIHYVEVVDINQGDGDYTVRVDTGQETTPTATPTPTPTPTPTAVEDDYGEQGYGAYGYGGTA